MVSLLCLPVTLGSDFSMDDQKFGFSYALGLKIPPVKTGPEKAFRIFLKILIIFGMTVISFKSI